MTYSMQNKRFLVLCVLASFVIGISLALIAFVIWVDAHPAPGIEQSTRVSPLLLIGAVTVFSGGVIAQIWAMIKQEQDRQRSTAYREKTTEKLDEIKTAAEEVKQTTAVVARQTNGEMDGKITAAVASAMEVVVEKHFKPQQEKIADIVDEIHAIKHAMRGKLQAEQFLKDADERGVNLDPKT